MVRTLVSKSSVTIIPITWSPFLSFMPDTPWLTLPCTLTTCVVTVSPVFGSTLDFFCAGMNLQALPWDDTRTTWSASVAGLTVTRVSPSPSAKRRAYFPLRLILTYSESLLFLIRPLAVANIR